MDHPLNAWISAGARFRRGGTTTGAALCAVAALILMGAGCSKGGDQARTDPAQETPKEQAAPAKEATVLDQLPPMLRAPWKGDLDEIAKRRVVRVLLPFRRPEFFYMEGRPTGILQEAFQELEKLINAKYKTTAANRIVVAALPTPSDQLRDRMLGGYGDIAAYGISITEDNRKLADFTIPTATGLKILVVTGPGAPELARIEDLSGKEVWVNPQTRMRKDLEGLNSKLAAQGKPPVQIRETDPILEPGDIMEMVNSGLYPISLVQSLEGEFWSKVLTDAKVRTDLVLSDDVELGWAIQKGTPQLKAFLDDFIHTHGAGTSFGNTVIRRYLQGAKYVKNATEASELRKFREAEPAFRKHAGKYDLDYLMIAAMGYQESRLDQGVKSPVGAIGIMQVMPTTAAGNPVNVKDIQITENNILAGVKLIHYLIEDYFNEPGLDHMNRTLLAIAAYNAGPEKIRQCRELAKSMGYNPNIWFANVEIAVAKKVGRETTQYVANIYKYYLAYRLAVDTQTRRSEVLKKARGAKTKQ